MDQLHSEQMELFVSSPFSVRLPVLEALDLFWEHDWSRTAAFDRTVQHFNRLRILFTGRYVDEISKFDIEGMRQKLGVDDPEGRWKALKPNTINKAHTIFKRMFNWLYECQEAQKAFGIDFTKIPLPRKNPCNLVPKTDERPFMRDVPWMRKHIVQLQEAAILLGDVDMSEIIDMLYKLSMRQSDLFRMTEKNVKLAQMIVTGIQNKTITRKYPSGVPYLNAITPSMKAILERRIAKTQPGEPLFKKTNLQKRFNRVRKLAKLPSFRLDDIRHVVLTLLTDNLVAPRTIQEFAGHTTLRQQPTYTQRSLVHLRHAVNVLEREDTEILTPSS